MEDVVDWEEGDELSGLGTGCEVRTHVGFLDQLLHRVHQPLLVQPDLSKAILTHFEPAVFLLGSDLSAFLLQDDILGRYPSRTGQELESVDGSVIA